MKKVGEDFTGATQWQCGYCHYVMDPVPEGVVPFCNRKECPNSVGVVPRKEEKMSWAEKHPHLASAMMFVAILAVFFLIGDMNGCVALSAVPFWLTRLTGVGLGWDDVPGHKHHPTEMCRAKEDGNPHKCLGRLRCVQTDVDDCSVMCTGALNEAMDYCIANHKPNWFRKKEV